MTPLFLGLDVGTTTITAVAFDIAAGDLVARVTLANTADCTPADRQAAGWSELDLDRARAIVDDAARAVVATLAERGQEQELAGVGVTGQMHGVALLDAAGHAVRTAITWRDRRVAEPFADGVSYLEELKRRAGPGAFQRTGCEPAAGYLGPSLFWLALHDELRVQRVCSIPDAIVASLTGAPATTDRTNAAGSGVFDVVAGAWDVGLLDHLGVPRAIFPPVHGAGTPVGQLTRAAADAWGLRAALPVGVALGDHQASLLGSVGEPLDTVHVNVGTGAQVSAVMEEFARVPGLDTRPFPGGRYLLTLAGLAGGRSLALLRDFFGQVGERLFGARRSGDDLYDAMLGSAGEAPAGADGLTCTPLFAGTRREPSLRGAFTGISLDNFSPGHLARALVEGVADNLAASYAELQPAAGPRHRLVGAGNGIRRNPLLANALAARFGLPLAMPIWEEEAAVGAALAVAVGTGALPDFAAAAARVRYQALIGLTE